MRPLFSRNPDYNRYEQELKNLHSLLSEGKNDTVEVELVHAALDEFEDRLTGNEMDRLNGLSADLYMLSGSEMLEPPLAGIDESTLISRTQDALERGQWVETLWLLRKQPRWLQDDRVAYLRGRCYARLGHLDTAHRFYGYAYRADPENNDYRYQYLRSLVMVHEIGKARALAAEWLAAHPVVPYDIQILAGTVLFLAAAASPNRDEAQILLDEAYTRLRSTLRAAEEAGISDDTIFSGWVALGRCLAVMGLIAEALNAFETVAPEYPEAWLEYERLSHWMSQKRSLSDIQESFREDSIATRLLPPSFHQEALLGTKLLAA